MDPLKRYLRGIDAFGHEIRVNYKGEESFNTALGGMLTIVVKALTLAMLVMAVQEMIVMEDPTVSVIERSLSEEEQQKLYDTNASEYDFVLVLNIRVKNKSDYKAITTGIPPEIGTYRVRKGKWEAGIGKEESLVSLQDC